jgi:D-3-phosphoglycerate dehydrogenase
MTKILINDGIHPTGQKMLEDAGYEVQTTKISQEDLNDQLNAFDAICVRSATKVRTELIDKCPNLKLIGRGGVGLDNIDVDYARSKNVSVINTPAASSQSVAELAFAQMYSLARFGYKSNRAMPSEGAADFKSLKKSYSKGFELSGKTLGIIGGGRIGQATAKLALGVGMEVVFVDPFVENIHMDMTVAGQAISVDLKTVPMEEMLPKVDVISLHIPFTGKAVLSDAEFNQMKDGVVVVNAARGGTIDEDALLKALDSGKVYAAGLDVFINEPTPRVDLLSHPNISLTPHIGASTAEAQERIGIELAEQIIAHFN